MEARDKMLDRAKANLRKAAEVRVSVHPNAKPNTQSWPGKYVESGVEQETLRALLGEISRSPWSWTAVGGEDLKTTH